MNRLSWRANCEEKDLFPRRGINSFHASSPLLEKQKSLISPMVGANMKNPVSNTKRPVDRRSFMKSGLLAGGAAAVGAGLLANGTPAHAQERGRLNPGDIAILRFLAAAELIESDLWTQYAELGGIGNNPPVEVDPTPLNPYQFALSNLDTDGPQYI